MTQRITLPGEKACQYVAAIKGHVESLSVNQDDKKVLLDAVKVLSKHFNC